MCTGPFRPRSGWSRSRKFSLKHGLRPTRAFERGKKFKTFTNAYYQRDPEISHNDMSVIEYRGSLVPKSHPYFIPLLLRSAVQAISAKLREKDVEEQLGWSNINTGYENA